jgi:hypothetical protein
MFGPEGKGRLSGRTLPFPLLPCCCAPPEEEAPESTCIGTGIGAGAGFFGDRPAHALVRKKFTLASPSLSPPAAS